MNGDPVDQVEEDGLPVQNVITPKQLYRGDKSGLKSVGFDSYVSRSQGRIQAITAVLALSGDELDRLMEAHAASKFLSPLISTTSDIRVACYFATNGCKNPGSIYVLKVTSLAKYNPFNTTDIVVCDGKTAVGESEWLWFGYIDTMYILDEITVTPDDCKCLPNP